MGIRHAATGQDDKALRWLDAALAQCAQYPNPSVEAVAFGARAMIFRKRPGHEEQAVDDVTRSIVAAHALRWDGLAAYGRTILARWAAEDGRIDEATEAIEALWEEAQASGLASRIEEVRETRDEILRLSESSGA